ncbi:MAG TPA: uroporphyrinogen-III C-methyltransferase [Steroidobacteraceae bacterium]|nr:uroporphyrinogen-III C-methyltransferase [Steroidobacteraceae bacterium]
MSESSVSKLPESADSAEVADGPADPVRSTDGPTARPGGTVPPKTQSSKTDRPHAKPPSGPPPGSSKPEAPRRRAGGWLIGLLAVAALAAAAFALYRERVTRADLAALSDALQATRSDLQAADGATGVLRRELDALTTTTRTVEDQLRDELSALRAVPAELAELRSALTRLEQDIQNQGELPQQIGTRAEARRLLELAQHRLALDRDVATALQALALADAMLADSDDPALAPVRAQIAEHQAALEAVPQPDRAALLHRLAAAERRVPSRALSGSADSPGPRAPEELPAGGLERAWALLRNAFSDLITVRRDADSGTLVSADLGAMRREHLEALLVAARTALIRADQAAFESALAGAAESLDPHFDGNEP